MAAHQDAVALLLVLADAADLLVASLHVEELAQDGVVPLAERVGEGAPVEGSGRGREAPRSQAS